MGRLFPISSVYSSDTEVERQNDKMIKKWFLESQEAKTLFESLGFKEEEVLIPEVCSRENKSMIYCRDTGKQYPWSRMVSKGIAVRNKLLAIKKDNEELGHPIKDDDIIIYFDGDNQIPLGDSIGELVKQLKNYDYVIACRGDKYGIEYPRVPVESFENFLVSNTFFVSLPDAQCGCWGFKGKFLDELLKFLTAEGFEIELDVLIYFLTKKIYPHYIKVDVKEEGKSEFKVNEDHRIKLRFLLIKLGLLPKDLPNMLSLFTQKTSLILPSDYTKLFSHYDILSINNDSDGFDFDGFDFKNIEIKHICHNEKLCEKYKLPKFHPCFKS